MTRAPFLLPVMIALTACGTPQEQCINASTRDLRTVDRLIAETKTNLARGYAVETQEVTHTEWVICEYIPVPPVTPGGPVPPPKPRYCFDDVTDTVKREVAIDPALEKRKLAGLEAKKKELGRAAAAAVISCQAKYPEEG
jgi:hypothetical protein